MIPRIQRVIQLNWKILLTKNDNRGVVPNLQTLLIFLFERFKSHETAFRREATKLWEILVTKSPPKIGAESMPNDLKGWIKDYYCK